MNGRESGERTLRTAAELVAAGLLAPERAEAVAAVTARYVAAITPSLIAIIDPHDANDAIARQFVPDTRELETHAEELADPIGDAAHSPLPGLVHRYPDRVLLKPTHVCPVYCRFCFRREMVGPHGTGEMSAEDLAAALAYIRARPAIREVIITGGDPLILSPRRLSELSAGLGGIAHLDWIRWHTRVPIAAPSLLTSERIDALAPHGKPAWIAIHVNHPRELYPEARAAIERLQRAGFPLLSQTVLLKGVNNDASTLEALFRALVALKVKPYYLHHADLAPGTAHFRTTIPEGQAIMRTLKQRLSGLALPTYVLDVPGGHGKVPIGPSYLETSDQGRLVQDVSGERHRHPDLEPVQGRERPNCDHPIRAREV